MYERERKDHVKYLDDDISWKYFVRIVKLWNDMCNEAFPNGFTSLSCFKSFLKNLYKSLFMNVFDVDMVCSWSISRECPSLTEYIFFSLHFFKNTIRQFSTIRFSISRLSIIVRVNGIMDLLNLFDIDVLSVQRQTLQTVTRYSYALSSFCCRSRNCYSKHRWTSPSYFYANYTSFGYVTLMGRYVV